MNIPSFDNANGFDTTECDGCFRDTDDTRLFGSQEFCRDCYNEARETALAVDYPWDDDCDQDCYARMEERRQMGLSNF